MFDVHQLNNVIHVVLGSIALLGGCVALWVIKGSSLHIKAGKVFVWSMLPVVTTSLIAMFFELLPLAIVLSLAELYLLGTALLSIEHQRSDYRRWMFVLMAVAGLLAIFAAIQFIRFNLSPGPLFVGPAVLAALFTGLLIGDLRVLRPEGVHRHVWLRRHLSRMILAFTIAVMALVRIGVNFGLTFEASVILPLAIAAGFILWVRRRFPLPASMPASPSTGSD